MTDEFENIEEEAKAMLADLIRAQELVSDLEEKMTRMQVYLRYCQKMLGPVLWVSVSELAEKDLADMRKSDVMSVYEMEDAYFERDCGEDV